MNKFLILKLCKIAKEFMQRIMAQEQLSKNIETQKMIYVVISKHIIYFLIFFLIHFLTDNSQKMGDTVSMQQKENLIDKLMFVEQANDPRFGSMDIFRVQEPPYEYLMLFEKTFSNGDNRYNQYVQLLNVVRSLEHKNFAKIHMVQEKQEKNMCIINKKVRVYNNFYNFTFRQAIEKKKYRESKFAEPELIYAMWCLLDLAVYLKKHMISYGNYRSDQLFLSPQGYVKLYLLQLHKNNSHFAYHKALVSRSQIQNSILTPQQLVNLERLESQPKIDFYKADVFRIGMVIIEMLTLDHVKFYYNDDRNAYKMGRINFELSSLNIEYSVEFLNILKGCLAQNPCDRYSLEQALCQIEGLRKDAPNTSYCLRLHQDQQTCKKRKPLTSVKGQYILSGIEKRLTPGPIKSMASSIQSISTSKKTSI